MEHAPLWNEDRPFETVGLLAMLSGALIRSPGYHAALAILSVLGFLTMIVATSLKPG